jgi:predicted MFS family arabinose efflux permease
MRWRILFLLFLARVALGFQFQTLGSVSRDLVGAFALDYAAIGSLIGLFMLPGLFLSLPAGFAGRYLSDRILVTVGLALLAAGGAVGGFADGYQVLAVARLLCGIGFVVSTVYFAKMVADWFAGREIASAMGILVMSWPFGIAMGQISHEWLAAVHGWRIAFLAASIYCAVATLAVLALYRAPQAKPAASAAGATALLTRRETLLTFAASLVWALFNAGYVVYLSFAPMALVGGGYEPLAAAGVVSLASWVMIASGAAIGYVADRTGRSDALLYGCIAVAMGSLALLGQPHLAVMVSLALGLLGMAPAGIIMALTGEAMSPERRAFGMGVFFSVYFCILAPAPAIAGWLYDRSGDPFDPILLAIVLFGATAAANLAFRLLQHATRRDIRPATG